MKYPRGSEWRKWDLHIHTPESELNNQFRGDWDEYVKNLFSRALQKGISVIGITDYFHIEGYKKVKEYLKDEQKMLRIFDNSQETVDKIKQILILPNIELRLNKIMHHGNETKKLTLHVIFADEKLLSISDIEEHFLHDLEFTYEGNPQNPDEVRKLKISNLVDLGRRLKTEHARFNDKSDLFVGMSNAVVDDKKVVQVISSQPKRFKNKYLIGLAEEYTSLLDWDSQDHLTRKVLLQKSDFIFSSNQNTRFFCLGEKHRSEKEFVTEFKSIKPCFWGSDAHDFEKMFEPDEKRHTWIKADSSFEGLRQTTFEAADRVYIGEEPPEKTDKSRVIKSIVLKNAKRWFENKEYFFNEGLVSVIGGKGAGKTALLDLIAYAADGCVKEIYDNENSFLKRACLELQGTKVEIKWGDGNSTERDIVCCKDKNNCENVVYLPQSFVANLCSGPGKGKLQRQIENVIFQNIPEEDRAHFNTFSEYKEFKLQPIILQKEKVKHRIWNLNKNLKDKWDLINKKVQAEKDMATKKDLLAKREAELKRISDSIKNADFKKKIEQMSGLQDQQRKIETEIASVKERISLLVKVRSDVEAFRDYTDSFFKKLKENLKSLGILDDAIDDTNISLSLDIDEIISKKDAELNELLRSKVNELKKGKENISQLDRALSIDRVKKNKLLELEGLLKINKKEIENLTHLLASIGDAEGIISSLQDQQLDIFQEYFKVIFEEKEILQGLYAPLQETLKLKDEENERLFEFFIEFDFDINSFTCHGDTLIDHRKEGKFHNAKPEEFLEKIKEIGLSLDLFQNCKVVNGKKELDDTNKGRINDFITKVKGLFGSSTQEIEDKLVVDLEKYYIWLFSMEYYKIGYTIKFNGKEVENLSPGLKGVALLILFLELDKEDNRPILIDQPEENLDNRSVYRTLKRYFREAKKRRQIFIVTHNPNLVVNTDSEQIYVANFDTDEHIQPSIIDYVSGGIENSYKKQRDIFPYLQRMGIRQHILDVLEGSEKAFKQREKKYSIEEGEINS